jgi:DNA repair exonuclease SbcCD ATPase subunit
VELAQDYLKLLGNHIEAFATEIIYKGTNEEFRDFERHLEEINSRLENSILKNQFEDYEQIKLDAIEFKNRLDDSQLVYNVAKHKMHLKLTGEFDPKIEIEVQVAKLVTLKLRKTNDIFENRILEAGKRINRQAEEKKDFQSKITQMQVQMDQLQNQNDQLQTQLQQVTSQIEDSESANEELKSQNVQLAEQLEEHKSLNEEAVNQLQRGMLSFRLFLPFLLKLMQFVTFSCSIVKH